MGSRSPPHAALKTTTSPKHNGQGTPNIFAAGFLAGGPTTNADPPPVRAYRAATEKASGGSGGGPAGTSTRPTDARTLATGAGRAEWPPRLTRVTLAALVAVCLAFLVLFAEVYISLRSRLGAPVAPLLATLRCSARASRRKPTPVPTGSLNGSSWWGWGHAPSLPRELLQRGVQYRGGDGLPRLATNLARGPPISVGVVGGSVSVGHGARSNREAWSGLMFDAIAARFPNPRHRYLNGAVGASGSSYFEACVDWHVPVDADIVFLEHAVNDLFPRSGDPFPRPEVKIVERLVRKLMAFKNAPVIVIMNFFR